MTTSTLAPVYVVVAAAAAGPAVSSACRGTSCEGASPDDVDAWLLSQPAPQQQGSICPTNQLNLLGLQRAAATGKLDRTASVCVRACVRACNIVICAVPPHACLSGTCSYYYCTVLAHTQFTAWQRRWRETQKHMWRMACTTRAPTPPVTHAQVGRCTHATSRPSPDLPSHVARGFCRPAVPVYVLRCMDVPSGTCRAASSRCRRSP